MEGRRPRKNAAEVPHTQMVVEHIIANMTVIRGKLRIPSFVQKLWLESGPSTVDFSTLNFSTQDKNYVGVTVVSAMISIFLNRSSKL